jgi:tetratricopeptide (TPR) repeat protein
LPFVTPQSELAFHLARSRSYFHAREPVPARESAELALHMVEANAALARFHAPALDRLAFAHLAASEYTKAAARYDELLRTLTGADDTPINRIKALLGQTSANLSAGQAKLALSAIERAEALLIGHPELAARGPSSLVEHYVYGHDRYAALFAGYRAEALLALGRTPEAAQALATRAHQLDAFFLESKSDDDLLALAQTLLRQAEVERARGNTPDAQRFVEDGLARNADFNQRTGSGVTETGLGLLREYAALHLFAGVPRQALHRDLMAELTAAYDFMTRYPSPQWRDDRTRFELYLTMLQSRAAPAK